MLMPVCTANHVMLLELIQLIVVTIFILFKKKYLYLIRGGMDCGGLEGGGEGVGSAGSPDST